MTFAQIGFFVTSKTQNLRSFYKEIFRALSRSPMWILKMFRFV